MEAFFVRGKNDLRLGQDVGGVAYISKSGLFHHLLAENPIVNLGHKGWFHIPVNPVKTRR